MGVGAIIDLKFVEECLDTDTNEEGRISIMEIGAAVQKIMQQICRFSDESGNVNRILCPS